MTSPGTVGKHLMIMCYLNMQDDADEDDDELVWFNALLMPSFHSWLPSFALGAVAGVDA